MAVPYYGDFPEDAPVYIPFNTFTSDDPSASVTISNLADTDIYYHKNGSDTDYSADAATLVSIDFDGITGNHMLAIDTSENAYFATGSEIAVRMEGTTVDGATINAFIGSFSIERAGGVLATLKAGTQVQSDVQTVLETNNLDHLCKVTTGIAADGDLSSHVVDQTILSHIMTLGADTDKFKASTDSLQGQRDTLPAANAAALATAMQADPTDFHVNLKEINDTATSLEQLMDLTTGVNADADLTGIVVDKSVLSHIMTPAADTSTYKASTESLEGMRNHIGDGTNLTEAGGDGDHLDEAGGTGDHLTAINLPNQTMDITGNITGNLSGSVGSVTTKTGYALSAAGIDSIRTEPLTDAETLETIGGMIHAIYCAQMQKQTVTDSARVIYKLDDTTALRTQTLADDDTTVTRGGG